MGSAILQFIKCQEISTNYFVIVKACFTENNQCKLILTCKSASFWRTEFASSVIWVSANLRRPSTSDFSRLMSYIHALLPWRRLQSTSPAIPILQSVTEATFTGISGGQLATGAQWNMFGRLMGHLPATKKRRARKLGCVVGASDTIMFINGYHRNQPIDRRMHP